MSEVPTPGEEHARIDVTQTLAEITAKQRADQIAVLEKVHQELSTRLNRARV